MNFEFSLLRFFFELVSSIPSTYSEVEATVELSKSDVSNEDNPLPFSISDSHPSLITHEEHAIGVAKLDDEKSLLILDFMLVSVDHQFNHPSDSKREFPPVKEIPYHNIVTVDVETYRWPRRKPPEMVIWVNSQNAIKGLPVMKPGRIVLKIERKHVRQAKHFASRLRLGARSKMKE